MDCGFDNIILLRKLNKFPDFDKCTEVILNKIALVLRKFTQAFIDKGAWYANYSQITKKKCMCVERDRDREKKW